MSAKEDFCLSATHFYDLFCLAQIITGNDYISDPAMRWDERKTKLREEEEAALVYVFYGLTEGLLPDEFKEKMAGIYGNGNNGNGQIDLWQFAKTLTPLWERMRRDLRSAEIGDEDNFIYWSGYTVQAVISLLLNQAHREKIEEEDELPWSSFQEWWDDAESGHMVEDAEGARFYWKSALVDIIALQTTRGTKTSRKDALYSVEKEAFPERLGRHKKDIPGGEGLSVPGTYVICTEEEIRALIRMLDESDNVRLLLEVPEGFYKDS